MRDAARSTHGLRPGGGKLMSDEKKRPKLTATTKILYGLGSTGTGVNLRTSNAFLMIFYSQAMGVPAAAVATVMMIAAIFDALVDPFVGQVSDNLRTRWGRRHPLMYAAALPTALAYFLIWSPPDFLSPSALPLYLLGCLLVLRFCDTLFELPAVSLAPELTSDYAGRTGLIAVRRAFEMGGGYLMVLAGYEWFMRETANGGGGVSSPEGYHMLGLVGGLMIFSTILVSTYSTHRFIPFLSSPPQRKLAFRDFLREMKQTLDNKAFIIIAAAGAIYATGVGVTQSLQVYLNLYFWGLSQGQVALLATIQIPASLLGVALAPVLVRRYGKKFTAILFPALALTTTLASPTLQLLGLLPEGSALFAYLATEAVISQVMFVIGIATVPSMVADVVEESEVRTGRRSEGLVFSADNMARKFVSSFGVFIAGLILTFVAFPVRAHPGQVDGNVLNHLILMWMGSITLFIGGSIVVLSFFPITRERHENNLRILAERGAPLPADDGASLPPDEDLSPRRI